MELRRLKQSILYDLIVSFLANYNVKEFCFSTVELESFFSGNYQNLLPYDTVYWYHLPIHVPVIKGAGLQNFAMAECILYA